MSVKFRFLSLPILLLFLTAGFAQIKPPPKIVYGEILNEKALSLPEPPFPAAARAVRATGAVNVDVTVDENGNVINAAAVSGHPLLRAAAVQAARQAKFASSTGKINGTIVYMFILPEQWKFIGKTLGDAEVEIADADDLESIADDLSPVFPEISKSIKTIAANFDKDEESARFQTAAIDDASRQLQTRLTRFQNSLWYFELGLAIGRIKANYFDEAVLRANLPKIRELMNSFPPATGNPNLKPFSDDGSEMKSLNKLVEMADKMFFSRKDKTRIRELLQDL